MRGPKCTISATHHVAALSWDEIFLPFLPLQLLLHRRSSWHERAALFDLVVNDDGKPYLSGRAWLGPRRKTAGMATVESPERVTRMRTKGMRRRRRARRRRRQRPITFLSRLSRRTKRPDDGDGDDDGDDAFRCIGTAIAFSATPPQHPTLARFSPTFHPSQTDILTFFQL